MNQILIPLASALATAVGGTIVAWLLARIRSGRLARTFDQARRVIDFVERWSAVYDSLTKISETRRADAETLMLVTLRAVIDDFAAERTLLSQFGKSTSSVRQTLLLYLPNRGIVWLPYLLFHTMLVFMLYVFAVRLVQGQWKIEDTVALLIAGVLAAAVRFVVYLTPGRQ